MTIQEIITKLNNLDGSSKNMSSNQWLAEVSKYENLFVNHPDADNTCTFHGSHTRSSCNWCDCYGS